jgi:serine/threonine-protein kinase RsbW
MPGEQPPAGPPVELELNTTTSPECLDRVHELFQQFWTEIPDIASTDRMAFETAVAEVAANILEHAARGQAVALRVLLRADEEQVEAHLEDGGYPYDADSSEPVTDDDLPEHGRGLLMARAITDTLVYERDGGVNHWFMSRRRTGTQPGPGEVSS